ncbi:Oligoxyloglucan reducing end-specific cellobiohydrolase [Amniculicola lignicola CBS 123094]|uniref:Oligoxyloglucan reducing end-specific cellobiohydrolase n=1 Tax=Amniculicola lignicola CBS 123094 TaxID=1392246 RepID=A0A6A5WAH5_9PLEO|nr:Oligoxyloglucan reducing end-specific cellobiohydrolase [Amniculicola lignicola CBS 123094]
MCILAIRTGSPPIIANPARDWILAFLAGDEIGVKAISDRVHSLGKWDERLLYYIILFTYLNGISAVQQDDILPSTLHSHFSIAVIPIMKLFNCAGVPALLMPLLSATTSSALPSSQPHLTWSLKPTNSSQQFRGLSPVSSQVVWVSGTRGTVLRTVDGGSTWTNVSPSLAPENATTFEFRDIQAWSANAAVILSIGEGNASRIYRTGDGGKSWKRTFLNDEPTAFYDCLAFENSKHGLALSDPVSGKFRLIETWDGGATWAIVDSAGMPSALSGEFGFAASGTCIEAAAGRWYIASGGVEPGRIFRSDDGYEWKVSNSSIAGGAAAGVFSVRFHDAENGIAVGGDFEKPTANKDIAAWSRDGGTSWHKADSFPGGYRSGVSWVSGRGRSAIAVGPSGSDITFDGGQNWRGFDNGTFDTVDCVRENVCWASGSRGRVARLDLARL